MNNNIIINIIIIIILCIPGHLWCESRGKRRIRSGLVLCWYWALTHEQEGQPIQSPVLRLRTRP